MLMPSDFENADTRPEEIGHVKDLSNLEKENGQLRRDVQRLLTLLNDFSSLSVVKTIEDSKLALAEKKAAEAALNQLKDDSLVERKYYLTIIETLRNVACGMALQYGLDVKNSKE